MAHPTSVCGACNHYVSACKSMNTPVDHKSYEVRACMLYMFIMYAARPPKSHVVNSYKIHKIHHSAGHVTCSISIMHNTYTATSPERPRPCMSDAIHAHCCSSCS